jgi:hypothetical protein
MENDVKENKMETITINGKEVKTNINNDIYPTLPDTINARSLPFGMSETRFLEDMVNQGYKRVTFYKMTTRVRGYHKIYANCKR